MIRANLFAAICQLWNATPWLTENAGKLTWGESPARHPQEDANAGNETRFTWEIRQAEGGSTSYDTASVQDTINCTIDGFTNESTKADRLATFIEDWIDSQEITTPQPYPTVFFQRPGPGMVDEASPGIWTVSVGLSMTISRQKRNRH
jgi:hypothetical protein